MIRRKQILKIAIQIKKKIKSESCKDESEFSASKWNTLCKMQDRLVEYWWGFKPRKVEIGEWIESEVEE